MNKALTINQLPTPNGVGSLEAYIQAANGIPILSVDEEKNLAERFVDNSDLDAARQLVLAHLRFVIHIARSYTGYGLPIGDLIQEGNIGLMKAVKRFDPTQNVRLVSFAVHWIRAEIHEFVLKNWRIVKIATTKAQRKLFFNLRKSKKNLGWLTNQEIKAMAKDLDVPTATVVEMESRIRGKDITFDQPNDDSAEDNEKAFSPSAYLEDYSNDPARNFENEDWETKRNQKLFSSLEKLDDRSQDIIKSRWLSDKKATLHDLADRYSISAERIRQLEANALKKMQFAIAAS